MENRMISLDLSIHIHWPLSQVFAFITIPENDFQWQYGTLVSERVTSGEVGEGTLFRSVGHFLGRRMERVFQVTRFEQNKLYAYKSLSGPLSSQTLYRFAFLGARTVLQMAVQLDPGSSLGPVGFQNEKQLRNQYRQDLQLLRTVLETIPSERSPHLPGGNQQARDPE
jgi:hypothetical protein